MTSVWKLKAVSCSAAVLSVQSGHGFVAAAPLRAEPVIAGVLSQSDTQRVSLAPALCKLYIIGTPSPK